MKKRFSAFIALTLLFLSVIGVHRLVSASGFNVESGDAVVISEPVDGTLMIAGGNVIIEGDVNGTLFVAGETITIEGNVNGPIFVAGNTILLRGNSEGEVFAAGNTIQVTENAELARDVFAAGSRFILNGTVGRDLFVGSNTAQIQNEIGRDARIGSNTLTFSQAGQINGDLFYQSQNEVSNIDQYVEGEVSYTEARSPMNRQENRQRNYLFTFLRMAGTIVSALLIWLLLRRLTQNRWLTLSPEIARRPYITLLIGLGLFFSTFILFILGLVTVAFSNLAFLLLLLFLVVVFLAKIVVASILSKYFSRRQFFFARNEWMSFLAAYVLICFGSRIPMVGWVVTLLCIFYALGLAFQEMMRRMQLKTI